MAEPAPAATAAAAPAEAPKPADPPAPTPAVRWAEGFSSPESVLVDEAGDRYLVSNINGKPLDVDGNGYISELSPDGKLTKDKFIAGGANKAKLDGPKGLGISKGVLYVSDISFVRKFDAKTGAPKGEIAVEGATFLNDIAVAPDGRVFVSDSGLKAKGDGFEPSGVDAVYMIDKTGRPKAIAKSTELGAPNGLLFTDKGLLAVTGNGELYQLDDKGVRQQVTKLPAAGLDGIFASGNKLYVSSWKGSAIYSGELGGTFTPAFQGLKAPADISYDSKRKRVLVPRFMDNAVEAYDLK
jgi:DNA-binding beta-propeller fold protein YncE